MKRLVLILALLALWNGSPAFAANTSTFWYWMDGDKTSKTPAVTDRASVQAILDLATPTRRLYGQFSPGNLDVDSALWVHGNTTIFGTNTTITRSRLSDGDAVNTGAVIATAPFGLHTLSSSSATVSNIEISGLTLDGNCQNLPLTVMTGHPAGIHARSVQDLVIHNVTVRNTHRSAYMIQECLDVSMDRVRAFCVGQTTIVTTRNAFDFYNYNTPTAGYGQRYRLSNFEVKNCGDEAISLTSVGNVAIANGVVDSVDYVLEIQSDSNNTPMSSITMTNVSETRGQMHPIAIFSGASQLSDISITNGTFQGDAATHSTGAISCSSGSGKVRNLIIADCSFTNINTLDANVSSIVWADFLATTGRIDGLRLSNLLFRGKIGATKSNYGVGLQGSISNATISNVQVKQASAIGFFAWWNGAATYMNDITWESCRAESVGNHGWFLGVQDPSFTMRGLTIRDCEVVDAGMSVASSGGFFLQNNVAGGKMARVRLENLVTRKSSAPNFTEGLRIGNSNNFIDSVDVVGGDFDDIATKVVVGSGATNVRFLSSRHGVTLRDAVNGGNGATDPALYSEKTLALGGAISGQAAKSVDIVSKFSGSSAFTNLSLNGLHAINQYGIGGSGGGDVATGIALGGYSEYRGNTTITGSLYGGELAATAYNSGTIANMFGSLNTAQITTGATATVTTLRGSQSLARVAGSGTGTVTAAVAVEGVAGMQNTAAGTITDAIGGRFNCIKDGGVTGTITNAYGIVVNTVNQGGTNNYAIRVTGAAAGGSNINRSLSIDAGQVFFGDSIRVDKGFYVGGQFIPKILRGSASINFDLTAVTCQDATITVTGAADGDDVMIGIPNTAITTDVTYYGWVSAPNTVAIRACDGALAGDPNAGTFSVTVIKR